MLNSVKFGSVGQASFMQSAVQRAHTCTVGILAWGVSVERVARYFASGDSAATAVPPPSPSNRVHTGILVSALTK